MATDLTPWTDPTLAAHRPGAFVAVGEDPDLDAAFDHAVAVAVNAFGENPATASIVHADPADLTTSEHEPLPLAAAVRAAQLAVTDLAGELIAIPWAPSRVWKRRKVTLRTTDPALELPRRTPGPVQLVTVDFERTLADLAADAGAGPQDGEILESVELSAYRASFKPEVAKVPSPNRRHFEGRLPDGRVIATGATASEVRRSVVALLKAGPVEGIEQPEVGIVAVTTRADGQPWLTVHRRRSLQRATLKVTWADLKDPARRPVAGWVFAGTVSEGP